MSDALKLTGGDLVRALRGKRRRPWTRRHAGSAEDVARAVGARTGAS